MLFATLLLPQLNQGIAGLHGSAGVARLGLERGDGVREPAERGLGSVVARRCAVVQNRLQTLLRRFQVSRSHRCAADRRNEVKRLGMGRAANSPHDGQGMREPGPGRGGITTLQEATAQSRLGGGRVGMLDAEQSRVDVERLLREFGRPG